MTIAAMPPLVQKILASKGLKNNEAIEKFLHPQLRDLKHPQEMKGVKEAAALVCAAIRDDFEIVVWGDYDVDGTTGTALLLNFFKKLGVEARYHIPNRLKDGYGLDGDVFVERYCKDTSEKILLITVDCGISDHLQVEKILRHGVKVIVTDHHQIPPGALPECIVVNPSQSDCGFHQEKPAGVAVAFFLAAAIRIQLSEEGFFAHREQPNLKNYLSLVALGTISDLVELSSTNRLLVRAGFEALKAPDIPGLQVLLEYAGVYGTAITSEDIGFAIGPRINAAGRLGAADAAVDLLVADNVAEGDRQARRLEHFNVQRKQICDECYTAAIESLRGMDPKSEDAVVVTGDFHSGVIGIVASRLVEKYQRPTIVFSEEQDSNGKNILTGSGRSVAGINLVECLADCATAIKKFGGHTMAAGLTVNKTQLTDFTTLFQNRIAMARAAQQNTMVEQYIVECSVDDVMDRQFLEYFSLLEPFGPGNEKPVFLDQAAQIVSCRAIGPEGRHLQLMIRGKFRNHKALGFGFGSLLNEIKKEPTQKIHFTPMLNKFRKQSSWQIQILKF